MIVHLRVVRSSGETSSYEFRRHLVRVGAGSRNDLVIRAEREWVRLFALEFSSDGFRLLDVAEPDAVRVRDSPADAWTPVDSAVVHPRGAAISVGQEDPVQIVIDDFAQPDQLRLTNLGALPHLNGAELAKQLKPVALQEVLELTWMIGSTEDPNTLVGRVAAYVTSGPTAMRAVTLALPAVQEHGWRAFSVWGTGATAALLEEAGIGVGPTHEQLARGEVLALNDGSEDFLLVPVLEAGALVSVMAVRCGGPPERVLHGIRPHILALRPLLGPWAVRYARTHEIIAHQEENRYFRERQRRHDLFKELVTDSPSMRRVHRQLGTLVSNDLPVLLYGEAGTGKELLARALHHLGNRAGAVMISVHCSALDEGQLELELFGFTRNDASGTPSRRGIFELADGGTVFLDEVHAMSPVLQNRLHRVLVEGEVFRVGDALARAVDVRVVTASHLDLMALADEGRFRRDLALLLSRSALTVPPLRDRREDIVPLVHTFLRQFTRRYRKAVRSIDGETMTWLVQLRWPGNVRELQTVIERAVLQARADQEVLTRDDFHLR